MGCFNIINNDGCVTISTTFCQQANIRGKNVSGYFFSSAIIGGVAWVITFFPIIIFIVISFLVVIFIFIIIFAIPFIFVICITCNFGHILLGFFTLASIG